MCTTKMEANTGCKKVKLTERNSKTEIQQLEVKPWHQLPYNILVKICWFLPDGDRCKMANVCRAWNEAAMAPSLWRTHVFYLYSSLTIPQEVSWLSSRVRHIRHATLLCFGRYDKKHGKFLRELQRARLTDLDIHGTSNWCSDYSSASATGVIPRIINLLQTQTCLTGFQMRQAMLSFNTGINLLNTLASSSGRTLLRLGLEDFFDVTCIQSSQFIKCLARFPNLSDLTMNYKYLTDDFLFWLSRRRQNKAMQLNIVSWTSTELLPRVSPYAWACLAASSCNVKVYLILQNIRNIREVRERVLLKEIPMFKLDLVGLPALDANNVQQMARLLHHVAAFYGKNLSGFKLCDVDFSPEIEDALLNMLCHTPQLLSLHLHLDAHINFLGKLCELQKNNVIKLQDLKMVRSLTGATEFDTFRSEIKTWFPVLRDLNINFHIKAESAPNYSARREYAFITADGSGVVDSQEDSNNNNNNDNSDDNSSDSFHDGDYHCMVMKCSNKGIRYLRRPTFQVIEALASCLAFSKY